MHTFVITTAAATALATAAFIITPGSSATAQDTPGLPHGPGRIVVANRLGGSLTVIDVATDQVIQTVALPAGAATPEPMYVVFNRSRDIVFVNDRANKQVVAFDAVDFAVLGTAPIGSGGFHMESDLAETQLWITNDIDLTATVIDPNTLGVITTVPMPADLVALAGKPHDVVLDPSGAGAWITVNGVTGANDYVLRFSTETFLETGRIAAGKLCHVATTRTSGKLFITNETSGLVQVHNRATLDKLSEFALPGSHGAAFTRSGRYFYASNLPGGGVDALYTIDARTLAVVGEPTDAAVVTPHNLATTPVGDKLYCTHSGSTATQVLVYSISTGAPNPVLLTQVTAGTNPFGLAWVR